LLLSEKLVEDAKSLREALERSGLSSARVAPVMRTLSPLLDSLKIPKEPEHLAVNPAPARGIRRFFFGK
jgi:hypothetical protein